MNQIGRQTPPTPATGSNKNNRMKTLLTLALLALATAASQAQTVRGYVRSNGTYVAPYVRTPANGTPFDNLSYRGYPSQQPGYVSPRAYGNDFSTPRPMPHFDNFDTTPRTLPDIGQPYRIRTYPF